MGSRLGGNHLVSLTMNNLFKILISILLLSFCFSDGCLDFGSGVKVNDNTFYGLLSVQLNRYNSDNIYRSYKIDRLNKLNICWGNNCEKIMGLGLTIYSGKYYRYKFLQLSYGFGLGLSYIHERFSFHIPFDSEVSIIINKKVGFSFKGMIYPFFNQQDKYDNPSGLGGGFSLNLKILTK